MLSDWCRLMPLLGLRYLGASSTQLCKTKVVCNVGEVFAEGEGAASIRRSWNAQLQTSLIACSLKIAMTSTNTCYQIETTTFNHECLTCNTAVWCKIHYTPIIQVSCCLCYLSDSSWFYANEALPLVALFEDQLHGAGEVKRAFYQPY